MPASGLDHSKPRRARVGGMEMAWIEAGEERSGEPPLVLVHGFTGHRDDFLGVLEPLVEQRRVLVPDLRGHGDSSSEPGDLGWNFDQLINDLIAFLDHLEIDRCDLFGHSMGGMLTLRLALSHPERIRSLIFMCTAPRLPESISRRGFEVGAEIAAARGMDGLQVLMEKAGRADCSDTIATWGNRYWPHHQRRLCAMTPESFHGIGRAFFDSESLVDRLPEIKAPTLVMVGEFDSDFLPGADLFEAHLPNVTRVTLPGAEHHPHQENPSAWHAALETHLDDVRDVSADVAESATRRTTA